ncbi:MAG: hypothetical protein HC817_08150 [Saprospiraceae bacterium]|nr:hypothetical protein [Saprospiraceae bacterium]
MSFPVAVISVALWLKKCRCGQAKSTFFTVFGFFILYLGYATWCSFTGLFSAVSLPPSVLLYTTFPLALLLFGVVINLESYKMLLEKAALSDLVRVHIFRLIGVFFVILAFHNALPKSFALIAGLGDMITAITSLFVAKAIENKKSYARKLTYVWNTFGLIDIIFTAVMANVLTKISIDTGAMGVDSLAQFPFFFIPAFAPPTIIFLHVTILKIETN